MVGNVLSLFDGMSCGQLALNKARVKYKNYFASEIKKNAIKITKQHFPDTIHLGDVEKFDFKGLPKIDLLIGGSPCQNFSSLSMYKQELQGEKSKLFYNFLEVLQELKPKYFLLENIRMKKSSEIELNNYLGVKGIHINSNLVSYQNRPRIYWTNIPNINPPRDRKINFQDYRDTNKSYCRKFKVNKTPSRIAMWGGGVGRSNSIHCCANVTNFEKVYCLTRKQDRKPNSGLIQLDDFCRYLTRRELEGAQNVPYGYTDGVSYNQACDLLGDGWTVNVIAHIFRSLKKAEG